MERVLINCGTYTVDAMSNLTPLSGMQPGDMFVKARSPGHAMIAVDVAATNAAGCKIYICLRKAICPQMQRLALGTK